MTHHSQHPLENHLDQHNFLHDNLGQYFCRSSTTGQDFCVHHYQTRNGPLNISSSVNPPSYAHVASPSTSPPAVAAPTKKGEYFVVAIDDELYRHQSEKCKQSFIGKITYSLGDKPHTFLNLRNRLKAIWKTNGDFRLVPLGKGYYNISFDSWEDRKQAEARSRWAISPGVLRLSPWTPGFNPYKLNSSNAQVWLRIYELPFEFWHSSVILGIAKAIGTPIKIDDRSLDGSVGHYVRVLVDVDLATPIHLEVMVDGPEYCDLVHLQLENLPPFCPNCKLVGHSVTNCFKLNRKDKVQDSQNTAQPKPTTANNPHIPAHRDNGRGSHRSPSRLVHRVVEKTKQTPLSKIMAEIGTSNTFDALAELVPNLEEGINIEPVSQAAVEKTYDINPMLKPHRSEEVIISNNAEPLAPDSSALVPYVQTVPKSILKKPRREVPSTSVMGLDEELVRRSAEVRSSEIRFTPQSWADMAEETLDSHFETNRDEHSKSAETYTDFKFSSSTQAIVDLVRSKAAVNFKIKHPSNSAAQAMRSMVTKNWSSGNGG